MTVAGVIVVFMVIAVAVIVARISRRRGRRPPNGDRPRLGQQSIEANIPTFRIVSLGLQGSGKTLLLASMFQQLKAPARQCYYISASDGDVAKLNAWFTTMADTALPREWPRGTTMAETRRFVFGVRTRTGGTVHEVLRLDYIEYAGELLTDTRELGSANQDELFAHIRTAHALIGILDGQRIRQYLDGNPGSWIKIEETLNILIPKMVSATCPISFVITKWDLLAHLSEDENARLAIVRDMLMSNEQFRALVDLHGRDRVVRLIPVSAVGPGFAELDAHGRPVKVPSAQAHPTNVDVPLSAVVPDVFDQAEMQLNHEFRRAIEEETRRRTGRSPLENLASAAALAGNAVGRALIQAFGPPAVVVASDVLVSLFMDTRRGADDRQAQFNRELSEVEQRVQEFIEARKQVLRDMRRKPDLLEGRLPNSRLSGGWRA